MMLMLSPTFHEIFDFLILHLFSHLAHDVIRRTLGSNPWIWPIRRSILASCPL